VVKLGVIYGLQGFAAKTLTLRSSICKSFDASTTLVAYIVYLIAAFFSVNYELNRSPEKRGTNKRVALKRN
jgi:hypothetical protein